MENKLNKGPGLDQGGENLELSKDGVGAAEEIEDMKTEDAKLDDELAAAEALAESFDEDDWVKYLDDYKEVDASRVDPLGIKNQIENALFNEGKGKQDFESWRSLADILSFDMLFDRQGKITKESVSRFGFDVMLAPLDVWDMMKGALEIIKAKSQRRKLEKQEVKTNERIKEDRQRDGVEF